MARLRPLPWRRRGGAWLAALAAAALLTACATPPEPPQAQTQQAEAPALTPLSREIAVPPGAAPRSAVAPVNYDLSVSGAGEQLPDDGFPALGQPREAFERGGASWYGLQFHQRKTANGERYDMNALTAAHRTLPFGTRVCVRSLVSGREVLVRINDRGPYAAGRIIDLSRAAADVIDMVGLGINRVALTLADADHPCGDATLDMADADPAYLPAAPTAAPRAAHARTRTGHRVR